MGGQTVSVVCTGVSTAGHHPTLFGVRCHLVLHPAAKTPRRARCAKLRREARSQIQPHQAALPPTKTGQNDDPSRRNRTVCRLLSRVPQTVRSHQESLASPSLRARFRHDKLPNRIASAIRWQRTRQKQNAQEDSEVGLIHTQRLQSCIDRPRQHPSNAY